MFVSTFFEKASSSASTAAATASSHARAAADARLMALPPGWKAKWSERKQQYYFVHAVSRATTWVQPRADWIPGVTAQTDPYTPPPTPPPMH